MTAKLIVKNALKNVDSTLSVKEKIPIDTSSAEFELELKKLAKEKGFIIPLQSELGVINIYALW